MYRPLFACAQLYIVSLISIAQSIFALGGAHSVISRGASINLPYFIEADVASNVAVHATLAMQQIASVGNLYLSARG